MKTFQRQAAQGDVWFRRIDEIPSSAVKRELVPGPVVMAHSETGHHHQFASGIGITAFDEPSDPLICYLRMDSPLPLEHMRPFDTHEPFLFEPGCYEFHRQRENTPEGWRVVAD